MKTVEALFSRCSRHGKPKKRRTCRECNAAYMRAYLRRRRHEMPARPIWERARERARDRGLPFMIAKDSINIPPTCPALGLVIELRGQRSASSPSLDQIEPERGYVPGNVRVISDRANRLKGGRNLHQLRRLAETGPLHLHEGVPNGAPPMSSESSCSKKSEGKPCKEVARVRNGQRSPLSSTASFASLSGQDRGVT